jgi:hypothetical protein
MRLKLRSFLAPVAAICFATLAEAGPVSTYLRESSNGREETEYVALDRSFQAWLSDPSPVIFDPDGTIRNAAGRLVGWWGIDGRPVRMARR